MAKYRHKPSVIEAVRWTGRNIPEMQEFIERRLDFGWQDGSFVFSPDLERDGLFDSIIVRKGDYVIRGTDGIYYNCRPEMFEEVYEPVYGSDSITEECSPNSKPMMDEKYKSLLISCVSEAIKAICDFGYPDDKNGQEMLAKAIATKVMEE